MQVTLQGDCKACVDRDLKLSAVVSLQRGIPDTPIFIKEDKTELALW
jgi:hypothetical protein